MPTSPESQKLVALLKQNGVRFVALDLTQRKDLAHLTQPNLLFVKGQPLSVEGEAWISGIPSDHIKETLESRLKKLIN